MTGKLNESAITIAAWLLSGATAAVVGGEPLAGQAVRYWVDEHEQAHAMERTQKAAPGVLVTQPDGKRMLYATLSREDAEALLANAQREHAHATGRPA